MIFDSLNHIDTYKNIHPGLYRALTFLRSTDFSAQVDGRYEVEGTDLYYMLQSYETKPENPTPEAHKVYADIQMVLQGSEKIGIAPLEDMVEEVKAFPETDGWLYHGPVQHLTLTPGTFAVLFPQDAHAPGIAVDTPTAVRKCVFKVKL